MARKLAQSTLDRFRRRLEDQRDRLRTRIEEMEAQREEVRLTETSSERSPDPNTAEGGSLAFEMEKELSLARNAGDLLAQVEEALDRLADGVYGICEGCGKGIPVARLDVVPHTKLCVDCAANHR